MNSQDRKSIDLYLKSIIAETVKSVKSESNSSRSKMQRRALQEKETQDLFAAKGEDKSSSEDKAKDDSDSSVSKSDPVDSPQEKDKIKKGEITSKDVVEKLNSIRAGKSFKDEKISNELEKYVEGLDKPEKTALFVFLKAISQIVTGEVPEEDVVDPSDDPSSVKMKKTSVEPKTYVVKPTVIKAPAKSPEKKKEKKKGEEDTSGPVPISPKTKG